MKKAKITTLIFLLSLTIGIPNVMATYLEELVNDNKLIIVGNLTPSKSSPNYYYDPRKYECDVVSIIRNDLPEGTKVKSKFEITGRFPHGNPAPVLIRGADEFKEIGLAIPEAKEDLKTGKYIVFLNSAEYYIGGEKISDLQTNFYNINENILPYSESLEKEIINITRDLKQGNIVEAHERTSLPDKLRLTISSTGIKTAEKHSGIKLNAYIKNITDKDVYFYLDRCEIDFWTISVNGGKYFPMSGAIHVAPCLHRNLIKLKPNQRIKKELIWEAFPVQNTYTVYEGKIETIKIGYNLGMIGEPVILESNTLKIE